MILTQRKNGNYAENNAEIGDCLLCEIIPSCLGYMILHNFAPILSFDNDVLYALCENYEDRNRGNYFTSYHPREIPSPDPGCLKWTHRGEARECRGPFSDAEKRKGKHLD